MTTVLVDKKRDKMNVWKALKQALTKYYDLLTQRKLLIEETGTLN